jgi:hypothetical protein
MRERKETKAIVDRNIRASAVCSATLRDWKTSCIHAPTVMEVCSLRFRASCCIKASAQTAPPLKSMRKVVTTLAAKRKDGNYANVEECSASASSS